MVVALCLSLNPLHLYYSRTQLVVMMSSLLTTTSLYCLFGFLKNKNWKSFLLTAVICGFSFNFHHSIKPISIIIALVAICYAVKLIIKKQIKPIYLIVWIIIFIVSFGPRLMFTDAYTFFGMSRLPIANGGVLNIQNYFQNYLDSLKVIEQQPTVLFFAKHVPLLPVGSVILMILGLGLVLWKKIFKRSFIIILVILILFIPFTNSAITDRVGYDHRLAPLLPVLSMTFGLACYAIWINLKNINYLLSLTVLVIMAVIYLSGAYNFFTTGWANRSMHQSNPTVSYRDFQIHYAIEDIKGKSFQSMCIYGSYDFFPMFVMNYYFPQKDIRYLKRDNIAEDTIEIVKDCNPTPSISRSIEYCKNSDMLVCPEDGKSFVINYLDWH